MLKNIIIWIFSISKIVWEYDKFFSSQQFEKNLSESYHFINFSLILTTTLYILYKYFFPKNKDELLKSVYWIILITALSASCSNELDKNMTYFHFSSFSATIFYSIYIHKQSYSKKETLIIPKIIIIWLIVLKFLWAPIIYLCPYCLKKNRIYPNNLFDDWLDIDL